jgi:hypothetical protein
MLALLFEQFLLSDIIPFKSVCKTHSPLGICEALLPLHFSLQGQRWNFRHGTTSNLPSHTSVRFILKAGQFLN